MREEALTRCPLFQSLSSEERKELLRHGRDAFFKKGEYLFKENDPGTTLYVILSGKVKIQKKTYKGEEEELAILTQGDFFGEMAILDEQVRSATAQALEETHCFAVEREALEILVARNPSFLMELAKVLVARLRAADEKISKMEKAQNLQENMLKVLEEERERIALDLHDGPVQTISALVMQLQLVQAKHKDTELVQELEKVVHKGEDAVKKMRQAIFNLYPRILEEEGIEKALEARLQEIEKEERLSFSFQGAWPHLPLSLSRIFFSVFLEGTNNIIKHARAHHITLTLKEDEREWEMILADDGQGFSLPELGEKKKRARHYGVLGMEKRVKALGGELLLESEKGKGTKLIVRMPRYG